MIELRASFDRLTNLWSFVCDCGYELDLNTYTVMRTWRRLHINKTHPNVKVICT